MHADWEIYLNMQIEKALQRRTRIPLRFRVSQNSIKRLTNLGDGKNRRHLLGYRFVYTLVTVVPFIDPGAEVA